MGKFLYVLMKNGELGSSLLANSLLGRLIFLVGELMFASNG